MTTGDGRTAPWRDDETTVRIALSFDERFAAHAAATLQSVMDHAAPHRRYAIHAVTADLSVETVGRFERQVAARPNVALQFHAPPDVSRYLQRNNQAGIKYPIPTYYRLDLPTLLHPCKKVLYLDSDLIACTDVAPLFDTDIEAYVCAAVRDVALTRDGKLQEALPKQMGSFYGKTWGDYIVRFLGIPLERASGYFNTGVNLINIERWNSEGITEKIVEKARKLPQQTFFWDQDLLNSVLFDRVHRIDRTWNTLESQVLASDLAAARILHYAGNKPWTHADVHGRPYWDALLRTPFAADMVIDAMQRHLPSSRPPPRLSLLPRLRRSLAKRLLRLAHLAGGPQAGLNR